jgi:asparagine synthase (glutamine-hydrolysing)
MRAFFAFGIKPDVNESQIRNYLTTGYLNTPETIVPMVKTLPPAHWLRLKNGKITITRYWELPTYQETVITKVDATELLSVSLRDAVSSQLTSERPLGMYLSGGVDSTLVAAFASQSYSKKINTFSIGFENEEYDESGYARRVANYLGTNHSELIIKPDPELILKKIGRILDQPFGDSSIIPTFLLNQFARKEVVVALGGDGGDESMGGYDRYRAAPALQKLNILLKVGKPAVSLVNRYGYSKLNRRGKRLLDAAQPYPSVRDRYLELVSLIRFDELNSILHPNLRKINSVKNPLGDMWDRIDASNVSEKARILDIKTYLPNDLLFKSDTASMASGLEVRSPFLDYKYLEVAHLIPTKYKIDNNEGKHLLRQIVKNLVPPELVNRPKMGFAIPRAEWLRGPIKDMSYELLLGDKARGRGWFDTTTITEYWNAHQRGRDYDRILWPVLMFELWARNWVDQTV